MPAAPVGDNLPALSISRALWALAWVASAAAFAAGIAWLLAEESELVYWATVPMSMPLPLLIALRTPGWLERLPAWTHWAAALALWATAATHMVIEQTGHAYFLAGYAAMPLVLLVGLYEKNTREGGDSGTDTYGPPGGFDDGGGGG